MKKFILAVITLTTMGFVSSCKNPSMERGFETLEASIAELDASIVALNIDGMLADLNDMTLVAEDLLVTTNEWNEEMEAALATIDSILIGLANVQEKLDNAITKEQVAELQAQVDELAEGIELLVLLADYDYDGVINAVDKCPDTPLSEINNVDAQGCTIGD